MLFGRSYREGIAIDSKYRAHPPPYIDPPDAYRRVFVSDAISQGSIFFANLAGFRDGCLSSCLRLSIDAMEGLASVIGCRTIGDPSVSLAFDIAFHDGDSASGNLAFVECV